MAAGILHLGAQPGHPFVPSSELLPSPANRSWEPRPLTQYSRAAWCFTTHRANAARQGTSRRCVYVL